MTHDRIDAAILEALQADGRMPNAALAEKVGLSQSACSRRLDRLEKEGFIKGYHARLLQCRARSPDDGDRAHLAVGPVRENAGRFRGSREALPERLSCHLMSGEYDYILRIAAKDLQDYERIHKEWLTAMPHVTRINSSFALREVVDRTMTGIRPDMA
jgi:Lrp/AsnC family transcriptional regulator, leucine-responsive regulatory protein